DEAKATPVAEFFQKMIRFSVVTQFALYIIPVAVVLAIPIVLTATAFKDVAIEDIRLTGLFVWIELVWLNVWLAILMAYILPFIFQFFGGFISSGSRKYAQLLKAVILPMSVFIWAMISRSATPVICAFDSKEDRKHLCDDQWILVLRRVLLATIAVTGIFFVEKIMIHLVSVSYRRRQFNLKLKENKRFTHILSLMYEESRKLFPMHCPEFAAEDFKIADSSNAPLALRTSSEVGPFSRVENRISAAMSGAVSRFTGKRILKPESAQSIVLQAFATRAASEALARRLWMSFVRDGKGELYEKDIANVLGPDGKDEATAIFEALDKDCNGGVSLEEMHLLCLQIGQDRKYIDRSMHDIGQVIKSLDNILSFIVLLLTILVYAAFFSTALASRVTVLWGSVAAMSFAIAGIVQEFLGSCVFIFIKHPYDVGDRVDINNVQLIIEHISLLSTIFRQVDSGASIQIPNIVNNSQWIKNISRSKAMAESYDFSINAKTKFDAIENLKIELQSFSRDNKRDFQPEVDVELISLGNLSEIVLRVEICHKSNWSNETLRATRRNKFLCAILTALRKHSISSPGGGDAPLVGSWENPSYSVTITDEEAQGARAAHEAKEEEKRMEKLNAD
ncbi:Mechanosensitive ion channel-domain-containing protein, partial [Leptodontidium sp. 2 PMI_412]